MQEIVAGKISVRAGIAIMPIAIVRHRDITTKGRERFAKPKNESAKGGSRKNTKNNNGGSSKNKNAPNRKPMKRLWNNNIKTKINNMLNKRKRNPMTCRSDSQMTAKVHLGRRPIAQYNYQAAKKRKERRNAKAN